MGSNRGRGIGGRGELVAYLRMVMTSGETNTENE